MKRDLIVAERHHTVGRSFAIFRNMIDGPVQLQGDLMVHAAHAGIADAAPIAKNRTMHMTKEQMPDARLVGGDDIIECLRVLQHNPVHGSDACFERRMVHEQDDWAVGLIQFMIQPSLARGAKSARVSFCVLRVQQ
ncbi:hypothetical protein [Phaeobacter porticola]|uniref:Uncharacterized protein n=1 Tax=Phaeobacter porticola TaxID=1844006 RepID=A0A1L3IB71_9RHOB|nr:hypothetical protein [Phaeobacter porticola]APG49278.1 hypothetical protein PhaeoP97_03928 [Phaeobacter porticola]